jgi:SAM-dependent methyltransferase
MTVELEKLSYCSTKIDNGNRYDFILPNILKGKGKCIDIGSAQVDKVRGAITEKGFSYYGVDLRGGRKILRMDAVNLGFKKSSFDIAIVSCMLGYVDNWQSVIKESHRVLKTGGLLYFYEGIWKINGDFIKIPAEKQQWILNFLDGSKRGYVWGPSLEGIINEARNCGFNVARLFMRCDYMDCLITFIK